MRAPVRHVPQSFAILLESAQSAWWSPPPGVGTDCSISPVAYLPYVCEARFLEVARLKPGTFVKPGVLDMVWTCLRRPQCAKS